MNSTDLTYNSTLKTITERIKQGQYNALKAVNTELVRLYRDVGKIVSESMDKSKWGDGVLTTLSKDIQTENAGIKGFSKTNLFYMTQFYEQYKDNEIIQTLSEQISWSHNVLILEKCKDDSEREYYMQLSIKNGWSHSVLTNKIAFKDYERSINSQNNFDVAIDEKYRDQAKLAVKDEYIFDFLELGEEHSERELEDSIIQNLEKFLIEMNHNFLFVGRQYKIEVSKEEYFIDLLLYHRPLKSFVAIELKIGNFKPEYAGKMSFYLTALDRQVKTEDENRSIGIIICKEKDRTLVEYSLADINNPMAIATYRSHDELPAKYAKYLPDEKEIADRLLDITKA